MARACAAGLHLRSESQPLHYAYQTAEGCRRCCRSVFSRAHPLGPTLGPVLFQLPPRWKLNLDRLREFLAILPARHKFSIELRDESWNTAEVFDLLRRHNVALCIHDWRERPWPTELTADFTYIRFHGSGTRYGGDYPQTQLRQWADRIQSWRTRLFEAFVYFNNDIGGHAIRNAHTLREMLNCESQSDIARAA